jgi:hypothetical protein
VRALTNCTLWRFPLRQLNKLARHQPHILLALCQSYLQVAVFSGSWPAGPGGPASARSMLNICGADVALQTPLSHVLYSLALVGSCWWPASHASAAAINAGDTSLACLTTLVSNTPCPTHAVIDPCGSYCAPCAVYQRRAGGGRCAGQANAPSGAHQGPSPGAVRQGGFGWGPAVNPPLGGGRAVGKLCSRSR